MTSDPQGTKLIVGVFVGGRGQRLGGAVKGLLPAPNSPLTLIERLLAELCAAVPHAELVLVGQATAYAHLGLPIVSDAPQDIGPLGGLLGLLAHAERAAFPRALALSCDLPFVRREVLTRLASEAPSAAAVVAETGGVRNPLLARYRVEQALPAARDVLRSGQRSLRAVLDALREGVVTLGLNPDEEASLRDWDTPEDMRTPYSGRSLDASSNDAERTPSN